MKTLFRSLVFASLLWATVIGAQTVITQLPSTTLQPGTYTRTSGTIGQNVSGYTLTVTKDAWPASGAVMTIKAQRSDDNGTTWRDDVSMTLWAPIINNRKTGQPITTETLTLTLPQDGNTTRKLRLIVTVLQVCTISAALSTL